MRRLAAACGPSDARRSGARTAPRHELRPGKQQTQIWSKTINHRTGRGVRGAFQRLLLRKDQSSQEGGALTLQVIPMWRPALTVHLP